MARMTRRTKPARSSRGKAPKKASVHAHMTKRTGIQPSTGINGSPHGVNARHSRRDDGNAIVRRKRFGQF